MGSLTDQAAIEHVPTINAEFSKQESRKLRTLLDQWENFGPEDDDWLDPLMEQLGDPVSRQDVRKIG